MDRTIIITYPMMRMGGIEKWIAELMKYSVNNGYRVIWLTTESSYNESCFKEITCNKRVEKVFPIVNSLSWYPKIHFNKNERVTMLSFDPISYVTIDYIRTDSTASFDHIMILPHFTGYVYYPERFFKTRIINGAVHRFF